MSTHRMMLSALMGLTVVGYVFTPVFFWFAPSVLADYCLVLGAPAVILMFWLFWQFIRNFRRDLAEMAEAPRSVWRTVLLLLFAVLLAPWFLFRGRVAFDIGLNPHLAEAISSAVMAPMFLLIGMALRSKGTKFMARLVFMLALGCCLSFAGGLQSYIHLREVRPESGSHVTCTLGRAAVRQVLGKCGGCSQRGAFAGVLCFDGNCGWRR